MIKRKILVVDDEPNARAAIERVLTRAGYEVVQAGSGDEALYILRQRKIDCVLLDHLMSAMNGLDVLRIIKQDENLKIMPVVMLTGRGGEDDLVAAFSSGADDYLVKTDSPPVIIARIEAMLRLGKLQRELYEKNALLEKANADLRNLDTLKSEFVSTVSHELRTPLSITKEGLNLVLQGVVGSITQQQRELLEVAKNNIERLNKIIGDILDISKIEAGKMPLHKNIADINQLMGNMFSFYKDTAESKSIDFKLDAPAHRVDLYIDSDRIIQVMTNLLSNALKFTKEGGSIKIALEDEENEVRCSVEDTGIGIASSDQSKLFDKFQQFGKSAGPGERGTGLGLSIAKKIVQIHKGSIEVESALGRGSKFTVILPKYSLQEIIRECIRRGTQDAEEKASKFAVLSISCAPVLDKARLFELEGCIRNILHRSGDSTLAYKNKIIIFLDDTDRNGARLVEKRILETCNNVVCEDRRAKDKIDFKLSVVIYPDDISSEEGLAKKVIE